MRYFSDLDRCEELMRQLRWPGGKPVCPECDSKNIGEINTTVKRSDGTKATVRLLRCRDCRRKIYTKRGTIFEDSHIGLDKWFVALWAVANAKNGITSVALAEVLEVEQKSAWRMLMLIRAAKDLPMTDYRILTDWPAYRVADDGSKKPPGWGKFIALAKRAVAVPKEKVDARIADAKALSTRTPPKK